MADPVFATHETAMAVVDKLYPSAVKKVLVDHGYDNIVILVDETYAVRFPRKAAAYSRSQYERLVLTDLAKIQTIKIPKVVTSGEDPPYLVTSFLHGNHLTPDEVQQFTTEEKQDFAAKVADFAYQMHQLLPIGEARKLRVKYQLDDLYEPPWPQYFEKVFSNSLDDSIQDELARSYYMRWKSLDIKNPPMVLHDDLHPDNMLFQANKLVGVLDFADTDIGPPEQELRQLYRLGDEILEMTVREYEKLSGQQLNVEAIKLWAIMQDLAAYINRSSEMTHPSFIRATKNLNTWIPEGHWG